MAGTWEVEFTEEFRGWWDNLDEDQQVAVAARVQLLIDQGPNLKRPAVGEVAGSSIKNLKELRASVKGSLLRVLFVFDPRQTAILLLGGDKAAESKFKAWYPAAIAEAEELYAAHLDEIGEEGL